MYIDNPPPFDNVSYHHVLFDADRNMLYPAIFNTVEKYRSSSERDTGNSNKKIPVGIVERDILLGTRMSPHWMIVSKEDPHFGEDALAVDYVDMMSDDLEWFDGENEDKKKKSPDSPYLLRYIGQPKNPRLMYRLRYSNATDTFKYTDKSGSDRAVDNNVLLVPAWRMGRMRHQLRIKDIRQLVKPPSLSISMRKFRFYNITKSLFRLDAPLVESDGSDILAKAFGNIKLSERPFKLEEDPSVVLSLQTRDESTLLIDESGARKNIVIRYESMRDLVRKISLLQLHTWSMSKSVLTLLQRTKDFFVLDSTSFDVLGDSVLRLL
tara:strand:- start:2248 stop:3216 length:969 start_codon:yes stop_codon:yes gene_type:complete